MILKMVLKICVFLKNEIILVHLATFFSKNKEDEKKLKISNLEFGKSILKDLESFNLSKVIYTNTMYQHYKDKKIRQLMYTKTKSDFSIYLNKKCSGENEPSFMETFRRLCRGQPAHLI